jgi:pilus assembly protein Flp/PilA
MRGLFRLLRESRAATAVEYSLILALIFLAILVGVVALANVTTGMWNNVQTSVRDARETLGFQ